MPLEELVNLRLETGYNQVYRENGKRRIVVTANVMGRDPRSFVLDVRRKVQARVEIPPGYWVEYGGTFQQLESASRRLAFVIPATLALIFGLLVMAPGSVRDAGVIFTGVPLALTGGIITSTLLTLFVLPAFYRIVHSPEQRGG